jgi:hypothetical protein
MNLLKQQPSDADKSSVKTNVCLAGVFCFPGCSDMNLQCLYEKPKVGLLARLCGFDALMA